MFSLLDLGQTRAFLGTVMEDMRKETQTFNVYNAGMTSTIDQFPSYFLTYGRMCCWEDVAQC